MRSLPSTTALLCFEASARLGSFTKAAGELHITQGAVSRQVIGLEQRLAVNLFHRKRSSLTLALTEAGTAYLTEIAPLLLKLERATSNLMAHQGRGGTLSLSVGASLGSYWLIPRLSTFTRAHPEIVLNIATRVGPADFSATAIEASLEFGDGQRPGMRSDFVLPLELRPYASPGWIRKHGAKLGESTPATAFIHHTTVPEAWEEWSRSARHPINLAPGGPRYDVGWMAMNAAANDLGVVLLFDFMAAEAEASGRLRALSNKRWRSAKGYYLTYPSAHSEMKSLQTFRAWLLEQAQTPPSR
ncbi:LysR substrate-binding domain-containing protein [Variovorax terrae]|uniref:LysR substrate-binding domain-containing protein n=1 Tax=Variovorax terrae TaxID=2923278 RepID=A0A9X2AM81_9BURK|nr:LysR substrate-binding domain-containing protein [Variovorax terrae]MCJ0763443.1 LysR substrate-binding domain-containing protein [Variovorax terrae]